MDFLRNVEKPDLLWETFLNRDRVTICFNITVLFSKFILITICVRTGENEKKKDNNENKMLIHKGIGPKRPPEMLNSVNK